MRETYQVGMEEIREGLVVVSASAEDPGLRARAPPRDRSNLGDDPGELSSS
jgi:hypothetical protein